MIITHDSKSIPHLKIKKDNDNVSYMSICIDTTIENNGETKNATIEIHRIALENVDLEINDTYGYRSAYVKFKILPVNLSNNIDDLTGHFLTMSLVDKMKIPCVIEESED